VVQVNSEANNVPEEAVARPDAAVAARLGAEVEARLEAEVGEGATGDRSRPY
jgi:hypothetical protein